LHQREIDQKNTFLETLNIKQEKLLKEKEWLIKEVHHRVKNSLQIVTSLLYSQSLFLKDDTAVLAIKDSLRRMHAMSLIHQKLYQDENISTIMMPAYVNDLVHYLYESFDADGQINFNQLIEPIELDVSQAIPLGLILTESIVNAMKYAFINDNKGTVEIRLVRDGDDYVILKVSDNGIGFQGAFSASDRSSLGLELMQGLAKQLNGNFHISDNDGVQITIKFLVLKK
jgi:two-component sensor histidine kinase